VRRALLVLLLLLAVPAGAEDTVESVDVRLLKAEADLRAATTRIREIEGRIGRLEADQTVAELAAEERRRRIGVRLRAMYRMRHRGFLPLLFSAESPHELFRSARYLWWIVQQDQALVDDWSRDVAQADAEASTLNGERDELVRAAGEAAAARENALAAREALTGSRAWTPPARIDDGSGGDPVVATVVVKRRRPQRVYLTDEERARIPVEKRVLDAEAPAERDVSLNLSPEDAPLDLTTEELVPAAPFERSKGLLPMPARGTITRSGRGVAIAADAGRPIRAVHGGEVMRVLWIRGFGNVAIVDHGDGWHTVYGHAREFLVEPGQWVDSGDDLGFVGATGSLDGPRLHFEVRHGREAVDPLDWLKIPPGVRVQR